MMELVREWLMGITGAAILSAVAHSLMPEGGIKQAGRLLCGLMLLLAVLQPLTDGIEAVPAEIWEQVGASRDRYARKLEEERDSGMKALIQQQLSAYSTQEAKRMGLTCRVDVVCEKTQEGIFLPAAVYIAQAQGEELEQLTGHLSETLGLDRSCFVFGEGEQR